MFGDPYFVPEHSTQVQFMHSVLITCNNICQNFFVVFREHFWQSFGNSIRSISWSSVYEGDTHVTEIIITFKVFLKIKWNFRYWNTNNLCNIVNCNIEHSISEFKWACTIIQLLIIDVDVGTRSPLADELHIWSGERYAGPSWFSFGYVLGLLPDTATSDVFLQNIGMLKRQKNLVLITVVGRQSTVLLINHNTSIYIQKALLRNLLGTKECISLNRTILHHS